MIYLIVSAYSFEDRIQRGLNVPVSKLGYFSMPYSVSGDIRTVVMNEIAQIEEIKNFGTIDFGVANTSESIGFLREVQQGHFNGTDDGISGIETSVMDAGLWDVMNLKLKEGKAPGEYTVDDEQRDILLYVSEKYEDIVGVGDIYCDYTYDGQMVYRYIVAGVLDADSYLIDPYVFSEELLDRVGSYSLEYGILEVTQWGNYGGCFFSFGSENDYDLINAKLREISQKYGEQIDVFRISSIVGYIKSDADRNTAYLKEAAILLAVVMVVSLCAARIYGIAVRTRDYGIWMSCGATKKDFCVIIFLRNLLETAAAFIAGACAMYYLLHIFYGDNVPTNTLVSEIYVKYCISSGIAAGLLTVIISSAIPCALIWRVSSVNLLKGRLFG